MIRGEEDVYSSSPAQPNLAYQLENAQRKDSQQDVLSLKRRQCLPGGQMVDFDTASDVLAKNFPGFSIATYFHFYKLFIFM